MELETDEGYVRITQRQFESWQRRCSERAVEMRRRIFEEESSDESLPDDDAEEQQGAPFEYSSDQHDKRENVFRRIIKYRLPDTIDPYGDSFYLLYQFLVAVSFTYNACSIPLRIAFPFQTEENLPVWLIFDYLSDAINLIDIIVFQIRKQYIEGGNFMLKSFDAFNTEFEMVLEQAYLFRVARTTCYLLYFIHLDACLYYFISECQDFSTPWGHQPGKNSYIRCFYWGFLTTVTIGNVEDPSTNFEYVFQLSNFFLGLFIFSIVIGQVRDSVHAHSADQLDYRRKKNDCIYYMETNNIPPSVQKKVRQWFEYTWETQKILDEEHVLKQIPVKMHTEIAINVHIHVLNKVQLFKGCDQQLLHDLVLKLRPVLYLPGDYICRKGEIGREMYIISIGMAQVVGDEKTNVFATLHAGTAFGEISLLAIGGANRRTANIFSPGFTTLFILKKNDLHDVVKHYPRTQTMLKKKAREILKNDTKKAPPPPPVESSYKSSHEDDITTPVHAGCGGRFIRTIFRTCARKK